MTRSITITEDPTSPTGLRIVAPAGMGADTARHMALRAGLGDSWMIGQVVVDDRCNRTVVDFEEAE